jgi:hypothetical protein
MIGRMMPDMKPESLSSVFRRTLRRWGKVLKKESLMLEDLSTIKCNRGLGPDFEACRNSDNSWCVIRTEYKACMVENFGPVYISVPIIMAPAVSVQEALDILLTKNVEGMGGEKGRYNSPAQVAKMIGHVFTPICVPVHVPPPRL